MRPELVLLAVSGTHTPGHLFNSYIPTNKASIPLKDLGFISILLHHDFDLLSLCSSLDDHGKK